MASAAMRVRVQRTFSSSALAETESGSTADVILAPHRRETQKSEIATKQVSVAAKIKMAVVTAEMRDEATRFDAMPVASALAVGGAG